MDLYTQSLPDGYLLQGVTYKYEIQKFLGQGTFGITYLAKVHIAGALGSIGSNVYVAIKEFFMRDINGRVATTVTCGSKGGIYDKYKEKFRREAQNLSRLKHPHIVRVLELFEANNTVYYAMEYIDGKTLDQYIEEQGGITEPECLRMTKQIAEALSYMHENRMLHLDLKPSNIVLRKNGDAVLIDFGLSKQYDDSGVPETSTSVGGGTPGYAPIEQLQYHEGRDFPVTMDIYALGATMFKMLTGQRPPEASDILNSGFPIYMLQEKGISSSTIYCIKTAMALLKRDRFKSISNIPFEISDNRSTEKENYIEATSVDTTDMACDGEDDKNISVFLFDRTDNNIIGYHRKYIFFIKLKDIHINNGIPDVSMESILAERTCFCNQSFENFSSICANSIKNAWRILVVYNAHVGYVNVLKMIRNAWGTLPIRTRLIRDVEIAAMLYGANDRDDDVYKAIRIGTDECIYSAGDGVIEIHDSSRAAYVQNHTNAVDKDILSGAILHFMIMTGTHSVLLLPVFNEEVRCGVFPDKEKQSVLIKKDTKIPTRCWDSIEKGYAPILYFSIGDQTFAYTISDCFKNDIEIHVTAVFDAENNLKFKITSPNHDYAEELSMIYLLNCAYPINY